MADVQRLAHRALSPWLQHVARRPMPRGVPKGAPELSEVPRGPWMAQPKTAEALGKLHGLNGEATFEERLSAHFVLLRHGRLEVHEIFGGRRALGSCSEALGPLGAQALRPALRAGRSAVLQIPPPGGGTGGQEHGDFAEGVQS